MKLACFAAALFSASPALPQREPVIDNEHVRVLVVTDPPRRGKGPLHEHAMNRVMIYLDAGTQRLEYADGRVQELKFQPGEAVWSPAGGRHTSENTGGAAYRVVEVELRNAGREVRFGALDPVRLAPASYKIVIDNAQVRVLRVRVPGRAKVPLHEHLLNRVVVYLNDQRVAVTPEGGQRAESAAKAGDVRWAGAARHAEENLGDDPFEVTVVELK